MLAIGHDTPQHVEVTSEEPACGVMIRLGRHPAPLRPRIERPQGLPRVTLPTLTFTVLAMLAFAGNSLLCRAALSQTSIDAASFTSLRLVAGAITLLLLTRGPAARRLAHGNWPSALALFAYAAGFSFAYVSLSTATGALLLFASVQTTMLCVALWRGERLRALQWCGLGLAMSGVVVLLLPGLEQPAPLGSALMIGAGIGWGVYSLRGQRAGDPIAVNAGNFARASLVAAVLSLALWPSTRFDWVGASYALASGALASGLGYAIWYRALPALSASAAAGVQLSVPVIAALGGVLLLGETASPRLLIAAISVIAGLGLLLFVRRQRSS